MRRLRIIGIGVGDPGFVTADAAQAMRELDVVFVLDKSGPAHELTLARQAVLEHFVPEPPRVVVIPDPPRDRQDPDYEGAVHRWREARVDVLVEALENELPSGGQAGILVWGDPSLYDGAIRVARDLVARDPQIEFDVIAGISSIHALCARHRIPLNRVSGAVEITTGRRLKEAWPEGVDDVFIMLDSHLVCREYAGEEIDIYWGAYLGTQDEILVAGRLGEKIDEIQRLRDEARERKGWVMDSYLLRRNPADAT
ncbi:precorrin-6A synthase (deacetylating) [Mobilicoccus massiliensis]|uniref:precorrin-6A synthase (deacetylating) n=1 Tax=Mobilicoccus massiliensis TaxID=1522310 RepID=UPI00058C099E|nr:precorrin-6A synthase (deacetylating) [Mobilicoccus massiliensis]